MYFLVSSLVSSRFFLVLFSALVSAQHGSALYTDPYIAIRQTLNTYPSAIDSKNFRLLSQVFAPTVVANYGSGVGTLNGTDEVEAVLEKSLAPVTTQHALSTQVITFSSPKIANSTTYYTASHFGRGPYEGQVV